MTREVRRETEAGAYATGAIVLEGLPFLLDTSKSNLFLLQKEREKLRQRDEGQQKVILRSETS